MEAAHVATRDGRPRPRAKVVVIPHEHSGFAAPRRAHVVRDADPGVRARARVVLPVVGRAVGPRRLVAMLLTVFNYSRGEG